MAAALRVEAIRGDHRVKVNAFYWHPGVLQDKHVIFYVLADFFYAFVCKNWREFSADFCYVEMLLAQRGLYGKIKGLLPTFGGPGKTYADEVRSHSVNGSGFGVDGNQFLLFEAG
ncbi:hypothetical protein ES703_83780 [subsurface metagenome]